MTRILLILLATLAALLTSAASTEAATPLQVADQAWPASPCRGQPITVLWDRAHAVQYGYTGWASGVDLADDDTFTLRRCEITLDPVEYMSMTETERCELVVHEAGHLAGMHHTPTGVMRQPAGWYPGCHTLRDRIRHDMALRVPDDDPWVVCRPWEGRVLPCRAEWVDSRHRARVTWFRARTRGDAYAIRRVRSPR
jgi:hypothetical protein